MSAYTTIALVVAAALFAVGALYRLTPTETWPPALRWVGASAWYGVAAIGAVLAYVVTLGRRSPSPSPDGSSDGGKSASSTEEPHDVDASDYSRPPIDDENDTPTPDDDGVDSAFWSDMHDRGGGD